MNEYILLMHNDSVGEDAAGWEVYLSKLMETGNFQGGSTIGGGICVSKAGESTDITQHLSGYIKVRAESLAEAKEMVLGNPVFNAGGTVEIRELLKD